MKQGYEDIGKAKYQFFIYLSLAALGIFALLLAVYGGRAVYRRIRQKQAYLIDWDRVFATDLFVLCYATEIFVSYVFSDYRKEALWGTEGWYVGLVLLLTLCGLYFSVSRLWGGEKVVFHVAVLSSAIVFFLGILDRFSLYLLPLETRDPAFISTLGNINWFCGYLSVLAPMGICRFLFWKKDRGLYGIYVTIAFMAGFCQGGSSIFLFFGALFFILLWITIKKREWMENYFLLLFLWGLSAQLVRLIRRIVPDGYNYDADSLCSYMTDSDITLLIGAAALGGYLFLHFKREGYIKERTQKIFHRRMILLLLGGTMFWLALMGVNTWIGIPGLENKEMFLFGREWGNGRGAAVYSGLQMYGKMPVLHKLLGIGPDCFSAYAYSLPEIAQGLRDFFGANRLTNAHNGFLTALINTGILGVCLFAGIFVSFVRKCMKMGESDPEYYIFAVCAACYFAHNMVSFAQVLNLPFLFLILGMGSNMQGKSC